MVVGEETRAARAATLGNLGKLAHGVYMLLLPENVVR